MLALSPHLQEDLQTKGRLNSKALQEICAWVSQLTRIYLYVSNLLYRDVTWYGRSEVN